MLEAENIVKEQVQFTAPPKGVDDEKYSGRYDVVYDETKERIFDEISDTSLEEAKMPLPTMVEYAPMNLLPSEEPSMSEISSLLLPSGPEGNRPRPELLGDGEQLDDEEAVITMRSDDENYVKLEEVEEVPLLTVLSKTNWGQMIQSRFFLFFLITTPTVVIPCIFLPFAFFEVDHIFICIFLLFPAFFIYIYYYPEEDEMFIDDISDFSDIELSEDSMDEFIKNADFDPKKVYAF